MGSGRGPAAAPRIDVTSNHGAAAKSEAPIDGEPPAWWEGAPPALLHRWDQSGAERSEPSGTLLTVPPSTRGKSTRLDAGIEPCG